MIKDNSTSDFTKHVFHCWSGMLGLCWGHVGPWLSYVEAMLGVFPRWAIFGPKRQKNTVRSVKANFHAKMVEACGGRLVLCYVVLGPSWGHVGPVAALLRPKNCNPPCKTQCFLITAQLKAKRDHAETFGCQLGPC